MRVVPFCLIGMAVLGCSAGRAGSLPPGTSVGESIHYREVDLYLPAGDKIEDHDVRLIFDVAAKELRITEEDDPQGFTYATIPYNAVTSVIYTPARPGTPSWEDFAKATAIEIAIERSPIGQVLNKQIAVEHFIAGLAAALVAVGVVTGGRGWPIMNRWFAITFKGVPAHPEGFLILKLDEREYGLIWATTEAQLGVDIKDIEARARPGPKPVVTPTQKGSGDVTRAWNACRHLVEESLASHAIRWATPGEETRITRLGEGHWQVEAHFYADDALGASELHATSCEVEKLEKGDWRLIDLQIRPK